jgi:tRNA nucleotidyltransferase (CCA-adding enzyme)
MTVKIYKVGGCVRDKILGMRSKDIDFSVEASSYDEMRSYIAEHGTIFLETPEYLTIRAKIGKEAADFVLARKDGAYHDGRRPDTVEPGQLIDDLRRRDFTMNSIAEAPDGSYIDPFDGIGDIGRKLIRCVGSPQERFSEDALRMLRAIRFSITKRFKINTEEVVFIQQNGHLLKNVSAERIREELHKCFSCDTEATLEAITQDFPYISRHVLKDSGIKLKPTMEQF